MTGLLVDTRATFPSTTTISARSRVSSTSSKLPVSCRSSAYTRRCASGLFASSPVATGSGARAGLGCSSMRGGGDLTAWQRGKASVEFSLRVTLAPAEPTTHRGAPGGQLRPCLVACRGRWSSVWDTRLLGHPPQDPVDSAHGPRSDLATRARAAPRPTQAAARRGRIGGRLACLRRPRGASVRDGGRVLDGRPGPRDSAGQRRQSDRHGTHDRRRSRRGPRLCGVERPRLEWAFVSPARSPSLTAH